MSFEKQIHAHNVELDAIETQALGIIHEALQLVEELSGHDAQCEAIRRHITKLKSCQTLDELHLHQASVASLCLSLRAAVSCYELDPIVSSTKHLLTLSRTKSNATLVQSEHSYLAIKLTRAIDSYQQLVNELMTAHVQEQEGLAQTTLEKALLLSQERLQTLKQLQAQIQKLSLSGTQTSVVTQIESELSHLQTVNHKAHELALSKKLIHSVESSVANLVLVRETVVKKVVSTSHELAESLWVLAGGITLAMGLFFTAPAAVLGLGIAMCVYGVADYARETLQVVNASGPRLGAKGERVTVSRLSRLRAAVGKRKLGLVAVTAGLVTALIGLLVPPLGLTMIGAGLCVTAYASVTLALKAKSARARRAAIVTSHQMLESTTTELAQAPLSTAAKCDLLMLGHPDDKHITDAERARLQADLEAFARDKAQENDGVVTEPKEGNAGRREGEVALTSEAVAKAVLSEEEDEEGGEGGEGGSEVKPNLRPSL